VIGIIRNESDAVRGKTMTRVGANRRVALLFLAFLLMLPTLSYGQAVYGSIYGTIEDPSGAAVPNAKVRITSVQKGSTVETTSNDVGNYNLGHLIPGEYKVQIDAAGFQSVQMNVVRVAADTSVRVDGKLQLGGSSQTVEVSAEPPQLKTDRADIATVFTEKTVSELPIFNRNFTELQLLTPGTQRLGWTHASSENPQGSVQIFANGQQFSGTSFQLDGTDNQDPILGIIVINPTLESVTESKITSQNFDAEFGQATAGVVTAQTKSGGNAYHGSAFWFRRNNVLQARDPFAQQKPDQITGKYIPDSLWNQFGGSVGGPIWKDKLFFFSDYQGTRRKTGNSYRQTVPTALVRSTCLNPASTVCNLSEYTTNGQIYDPAAAPGTAFAGGIIPIGRLSAPALKILSALPAPTGPGTTNNYAAGGTGGFDDNSLNVRIDNQTTQKLHVFGRYSLARFQLSGGGIFGDLGGKGFGEGEFAGSSKTRNHSLASGFDYALSPTLITDFRFGYYRYNVSVVPNGVGTTPAKDIGIPGLNLGDDFTSGQPGYFIGDINNLAGSGGLSNLGYGLGVNRCNCPLTESEQQFQFVNNWTKSVGNHSFKFGGDIRYAMNLRVPSDAHRAGELSFAASNTSNPAALQPGGAGIATFLLGDVTKLRRYVSTSTDAAERQKRWFFYGQDTWRITPKLTLNYGLRWEIYFPQTVNAKGNGGWLDLGDGNLRVAGYGDIGNNGNIQNSYKNLAPRLGVAYQATEKTVVRMGYGRSFSLGVFGSIFGHAVTQNLPVLAVQELNPSTSTGSVFSLTQGPPAPVFPAVPANGLLPLPNNVFARALPLRQQVPTLDAWNLSIQHQITPTMTVEVAYVANKGTHVFAGNGPTINANQATDVGYNPALPTCAAGIFTPQTTCSLSQDERKPYFKKFGWTQGIDSFANAASSNYNSLQTKVNKTFSNGYQFLAHYTWSRAFNYDADYYAIDPSVNHGRIDWNRSHVFVLTNLVEMPFGRGKHLLSDANRVTDAVVGGWQINAVTNWSSGLPFTPSLSSCQNSTDSGPCRPNLVGSFSVGAGDYNTAGNYVPYFSQATLGAPGSPFARAGLGQFGNVGRNTFTGPGFFNTDLSVFKNFTLTERVRAQFQTEIFNVFNHVNLGQPDSCVDCGSAGRITSIAAGTQQRNVQFGLKVSF
jgi:hypothetical protein